MIMFNSVVLIKIQINWEKSKNRIENKEHKQDSQEKNKCK